MNKELKGQGIPFDPIDPDLDLPKPEPALDEIKKETGRTEKSPEKKSSSQIVVVLLVIFCVFSLSTAAALYMLKEKEASARLDAEAKLEKIKIEKGEVEQELQETLSVKRQLESDLQVNKETTAWCWHNIKISKRKTRSFWTSSTKNEGYYRLKIPVGKRRTG
jgi:hypothetical protein